MSWRGALHMHRPELLVTCASRPLRYTGEDGFEISVPNDRALELAQKLLANPEVTLSGGWPCMRGCDQEVCFAVPCLLPHMPGIAAREGQQSMHGKAGCCFPSLSGVALSVMFAWDSLRGMAQWYAVLRQPAW